MKLKKLKAKLKVKWKELWCVHRYILVSPVMDREDKNGVDWWPYKCAKCDKVKWKSHLPKG